MESSIVIPSLTMKIEGIREALDKLGRKVGLAASAGLRKGQGRDGVSLLVPFQI